MANISDGHGQLFITEKVANKELLKKFLAELFRNKDDGDNSPSYEYYIGLSDTTYLDEKHNEFSFIDELTEENTAISVDIFIIGRWSASNTIEFTLTRMTELTNILQYYDFGFFIFDRDGSAKEKWSGIVEYGVKKEMLYGVAEKTYKTLILNIQEGTDLSNLPLAELIQYNLHEEGEFAPNMDFINKYLSSAISEYIDENFQLNNPLNNEMIEKVIEATDDPNESYSMYDIESFFMDYDEDKLLNILKSF